MDFFFIFISLSSFSVPEKLALIKTVHHGYFLNMLKYEDYILALARNGDLCVYKIENNSYIFEKSYPFNLFAPNKNTHMAIHLNYLYIHTLRKLFIFDLSFLPEIRFVNSYPLEGEFWRTYSIAIKGQTLFLGGQNSSVLILSLEIPDDPVEITRIKGNYFNGCTQISFYEDLLITTTILNGITIWDISNLSNPILIKQIDYSKLYKTVLSSNGFLIINNNKNTFILDIRDKNNIGNAYDTNQLLNITGGIDLGNNLLLFQSSEFLFVEKSQLENPALINWEAENIYFYKQCYCYEKTGENNYILYTINDKSHKAIFDIDDLNKTITQNGQTDMNDFINPGEIAVIDNYLYTSFPVKGIAIYRINNENFPEFIKYDTISNSIFSVKGVKIINIPEGNGEKPYLLVYDGSLLLIADITDRENPTLVKRIAAETKIVKIDYPYLYTYSYYGKFSIIDISDINNPEILSITKLPETMNVYLHYYNDHLYIGKYIIDVSDKTNPVIVKDNMNAKALTGKDNLLITWEGINSSILKVYDLTEPENPQEIQKILLTTEEGNYKIQYPKKLFMKDNTLVCSYLLLNSSINQTTFFSLQGQTFVPKYIADALVTDFVQKDNIFYIAQEDATPLAIYGQSHFIPHIATTWGWETKLIADNYGESDINFTYILKNNVNIERKEVTIGAGKQMAIDLSEGQSGEVIVPFNSKLSFKVSYHHTNEHGIAEFLLDSHITRNPILFTPQYLSDHLTWMGVALSNCEGSDGNTTLTAANSAGGEIGEKTIFIDPMTRFASVLTNLFTGTDFRDISAVKVQSNTYLSGITISGNGNSQLLFTPATYLKNRTNTRNIPHIDVKGYWDTYLILDNPTDSDITVNLTLYASGNIAVNESKTIVAHSSLPVLINDYNNSEIDCGEITDCTPDLIVRLAYMFKSTGATAEFLIDGDNLSSHLVFNLPAYRSNVLTWWGIAIMNPENTAKDITLKAYSNGQEIDSATIHLEGHTKMADLIENIFQNLNGQTVERVIAQTPSGYISGLNICGSNQDRYLFTPAIPY